MTYSHIHNQIRLYLARINIRRIQHIGNKQRCRSVVTVEWQVVGAPPAWRAAVSPWPSWVSQSSAGVSGPACVRVVCSAGATRVCTTPHLTYPHHHITSSLLSYTCMSNRKYNKPLTNISRNQYNKISLSSSKIWIWWSRILSNSVRITNRTKCTIGRFSKSFILESKDLDVGSEYFRHMDLSN